MRRRLIDDGIYFFPLAVKQGSISSAHSVADIDMTLHRWEAVLAEIATPLESGPRTFSQAGDRK
jgi:glutamate-1-semialdehyde 2,1-aminomutase